MWGYVICVMLGVCVGIFLISLMQMARDPFDVDMGCNGDCNQGRKCNRRK